MGANYSRILMFSENFKYYEIIIPTIDHFDNETISYVQCEDELYLCELCSQMFQQKEDFQKHLILHEEKGIILQLEDNTENDETIAIKEEISDNKLICEICDVPFLNKNSLQEHVKKIHCEIFNNKINSVEHSEKSILECEICSKKFIRTSNLNAHIITHTRDYFCYVCCNSYKSRFKLDHHMTEHTEEELFLRKDDPAFIRCPFDCPEIFNSKYQLYEHKKDHNSIVDYKCDICDKKFMYIRQLNSHRKKHEENTNCSICNKQFSSLNTLREHFRLHTGEKPYECTICNQRFRCQSYLKTHKLIHSGVKNYKCGQCSWSFSRSNYLKDHMKIHFNEKPYTCEFCNQSFIQSNVWKKHLAARHRLCSICNVHVGSAMQLRMHLWKFHAESQENMKDSFVCFEDEQQLIGE